jgi:hypothetical protein
VLDQLGYLDGDSVTPAGRRLTRLYSELDLLAAECLRRGLWQGLNPAELAACVSVLTFESRRQTDDAGPTRLPKGPVRDVLDDMSRTWAELDQLERRNSLSFLREPDPGFVWAAYRWVRGGSLEDVLDSVPGLTPGDFVRSMKQLIDILDQIAVASRDDRPARGAAKPAPVEPATVELATVEPATGEQATGGPATVELATGDPETAGEWAGEARLREPAPRDRDVAATARAAIDAIRRGVIAYTTLAD